MDGVKKKSGMVLVGRGHTHTSMTGALYEKKGRVDPSWRVAETETGMGVFDFDERISNRPSRRRVMVLIIIPTNVTTHHIHKPSFRVSCSISTQFFNHRSLMSELAETKIHSNDMLCQFLVLMLGLSHSSTIESNSLSYWTGNHFSSSSVSPSLFFGSVHYF